MISGLYDLPEYARTSKTKIQSSVVDSIKSETDGSDDTLRAQSLLYVGQNIKASILILNGAKDDRTVPDQARRLAELINHHGGKAQAIIYPEYGHQIPVDARNRDVDPFIRQILGQ